MPENQNYQQAPFPVYQQVSDNPGYQQTPQNPTYQQVPDNQAYGQTAYQQPYQAVAAAPAKKPNKKMIIAIVAAAAVVFIAFVTIAIVILTSLGKTTIDMSKYYEIEIKGFNGFAKASVSKTLDPYQDLVSEGKLHSKDSLNNLFSVSAFFSDMEKELSKESGISNGDTVELTFTYNEELAKQLKLKIKNKTIKKKVSGLAEGKKVDLFADLEVEFKGISPNGSVTISNNNGDDLIRRVRYTADKKSKLKNGDKIVVTASYDEDYAIENGYAVEATSKEYTVAGLGYYLDDKAEISAEHKAAFEKEFKDRIDSILASRWENIYNAFGESVYGGEKVSVSNPQLEKGFILSIKDPEGSYSNYNKLIMIYRVDIDVKAGKYSSSSDKFGKRTGYVAVEFSKASISKDGINVTTSTSMYSGYQVSTSVDELESDLVTTQKTSYIVTNWK